MSSGATLVVEESTPAVALSSAGLREAIGIETLGGVFTRILDVGCPVPCSSSQVFSTAVDGQRSIALKLFRGTNTMAADNHFLGEYEIDGLPSRPRGEPKVRVTFRVTGGKVELVAQDSAGTQLSIRRLAADS